MTGLRTFTTVSTGGSPHNASLLVILIQLRIEWIAIAAMFLAGGSFALYYRAVQPETVFLHSTEPTFMRS